jgi:7-cyano-7-deazaguanine reductase
MLKKTYNMSNYIPIHGSMKRPSNPETAIKEVKKGRQKWMGGNLEVKISTKEFTSVCPTTGQPDFNYIDIIYKPNKFYIESKTIKFYLWSFRDHGAHCETLSKFIAEQLQEAIEPNYIEVIVTQFPRGGIEIISNYKI